MIILTRNFISLYKKRVRPDIEKVVSSMRDTPVFSAQRIYTDVKFPLVNPVCKVKMRSKLVSRCLDYQRSIKLPLRFSTRIAFDGEM